MSAAAGSAAVTGRGGVMTIYDAARALRSGETSSAALVDTCLASIAERDARINAFITVCTARARAEARARDEELATGLDRGPLHGVPVSIKDLIDLEGTPTTAGSRVRAGHVATTDAPIVERLRQAGAVIIGKTNLHEFAFGTTNEDSAFGPVHHPLDGSRSPGGSSGGSAASIVAGMSFASIGTDTGGSIRIPAAACGLVGLKPGLGEIPTDGVVPLSTTLDHIGPLCRSVEDASLLYEVLSGSGSSDPTARARLQPAAHRPEGARDARSLQLRQFSGYFTSMLDADVSQGFEQACARLTAAGASLDAVSLPHADDIAPVYLLLVLAEAAAYHRTTLDHAPEAYTPNVRIRLEMGRYILAEDYVRAQRGREVLRREVEAALAGRDALILPTLAIPAPRLGAVTVRLAGADQPVRNIMLRLTQLFNITGHPAITLPCGVTPAGLPIGLQLVGAAGRTADLLRVAQAIERQLGPGTSV